MAISTIGASGLDSTVSQIGKNILHNGAMTVAQRGTVVSPTNGFTLDRWHAQVAGAAAITVSQDTDVPSGQDFSYSLKVDVTTLDSSIAASDRVHIRQVIEAQNLQHLRYGDASAKTLSLTWWMKSPKSGTHCVALYQDDGARSYVREVTVSSADTWEKFTVTFPGDASGTINNDNGAGLYVTFPLAAGTDFHATADAWAAGFDFATSNQQNLVDSAANNFYITGVQLEVGSVATDFEWEDYGTTLAKCKRYYAKETYGTLDSIAVGFAENTSTGRYHYAFSPEMRAEPSFTFSAAGTFDHFRQGAATINLTSISLGTVNKNAAQFVGGSGGTTVAGEALILRTDSGDTATIERSAEL